MKAIEIAKNNTYISNSLDEVFKWKEEVYEETQKMSFEELNIYFNNRLLSAAKSINAKLVKNQDGSYAFD